MVHYIRNLERITAYRTVLKYVMNGISIGVYKKPVCWFRSQSAFIPKAYGLFT